MLTAKEWNIDFDFDDEQEEHIGENKYFQEFSTEEEYQRNKNCMKVPHVALITDTEQLHYCDQHDYVEIAGIKWATMNIGAANETDIGLYFQWGDTQGYTADQVGETKQFTWEDYKYATDTQSMPKMTKYNATDGKTVLDPEDDAVTAAWGSKWRMPTTAEFQTLGTATTSAWTSSYEDSGVAGLVLTDKDDSSKKLFFPACGDCYGGSVDYVGSIGYYWSSSLYSSEVQSAYDLSFGSGYVDWQYDGSRFFGCAVRGVLGE